MYQNPEPTEEGSIASLVFPTDEQRALDFPAPETPFLFNDFGGLAATSPNPGTPGAKIVNSSTACKRLSSTSARLLDFQSHLRELVAADNGRLGHLHTTGDETVLRAVKNLWNITQDLLEVASAEPFIDASSSSFSYPAFRNTSTATCHGTILQLVTCYAYLVQILESVVSRLAIAMQGQNSWLSCRSGSSQTPTPSSLTNSSTGSSTSSYSKSSNDSAFEDHLSGNSGSSCSSDASTTGFSLGRFSLAAESSLNAEMVLMVLFRMVQKTRANINRLCFEKDSDSGEVEQSLASALFDMPESSPIMMSARAVMTVVCRKETLLTQRMKEVLFCNIEKTL